MLLQSPALWGALFAVLLAVGWIHWLRYLDRTFVNWHYTIDVGGHFEKKFRPGNNVTLLKGEAIQDREFLSGLHALQEIVQQAATDGKRLRAYGSRFSLSNIAYDNEYLIETWGLNYYKLGLDETHVSESYRERRERLVFVQSGVMIRHINEILQDHHLSFYSGGDIDGQRVVGAISTGTHNSALEMPATQDFVRGIHLVIHTGEHVYVQRKSDPTVSKDFAKFLGNARLIEDDEIFNAAVVGLGSFGIIHGMLIELEPIYHITKSYYRMTYPQVVDAMTLLDIPLLGLHDIEEQPFHFSVWFNGFRREVGQKTVLVEFFHHKTPGLIPNDAVLEKPFDDGSALVAQASWSDEARYFWAHLRGGARSLQRYFMGVALYVAVNTVIMKLPPGKAVTKYPAEHMVFIPEAENEYTPFPLPTTTVEIGTPIERLKDVLDICFEVLESDPLPCNFRVRYSKKSSATLAFTRYNTTAIVDLLCPFDYIFFRKTADIYERIFDRVDRASIPHTFHWGKHFPVNDQWVQKGFGSDLHRWKAAREALLGEDGRNMFSSKVIDALGLNS